MSWNNAVTKVKQASSEKQETSMQGVVKRIRTKSFQNLQQLMSVDSSDKDEHTNARTFETIDHRIYAVERMLARGRASKVIPWKKKLGQYLKRFFLSSFFLQALPWIIISFIILIVIKFCLSNADDSGSDDDDDDDGLFDTLTKEEQDSFKKFFHYDMHDNTKSEKVEYKKFKKREKMLEDPSKSKFKSYEEFASAGTLPGLFSNRSYPKYARNKLSDRQKMFFSDLESLDEAMPTRVPIIYKRCLASRKLYMFAKRQFRDELEKGNLDILEGCMHNIKAHWIEIVICTGAFVDSV
jgi:hypothetical protein